MRTDEAVSDLANVSRDTIGFVGFVGT